jgi:hypothetical protein
MYVCVCVFVKECFLLLLLLFLLKKIYLSGKIAISMLFEKKHFFSSSFLVVVLQTTIAFELFELDAIFCFSSAEFT